MLNAAALLGKVGLDDLLLASDFAEFIFNLLFFNLRLLQFDN